MHKPLFKLLVVGLCAALSACANLQRDALPEGGLEPQAASEIRPTHPLPAPPSGMIDETPRYWFVQFAGPPTAKGGNAATLRQQRAAFRSAAAGEGVLYGERFNFERLFNGLSVRATASELGKLSRLPNVTAVYPVIDVPLPEPRTVSEPDMQFALGMTGADTAQSQLGLTGRGVRVGVIDSGVDVDHPEFRGRIVAGYDFVGDAFNGSNAPQPNPNPDDCGGHGTHVAGIIGAAGEKIKGVAPEVSLGAYRVFGCEGSTTADIIILALERALADGMDVVNLSLGAAYQWPQYPSAQASNNLVDAGVVVVASIGNSGATGVYSAGAPGVGEKVIGVASFDNVSVELNLMSVAGRSIGYSTMSGAKAPPTSGSAEIVSVGRACNGDALDDPSGKVALIVRGDCTFAEKALNAQNAGAVAAVVYNNVPGNFAGSVTSNVTIPVVSVSQADGQFIQSQAPTTLTWENARGVFPNPTGNLISSFSSYGLAPDLTLKPDLGAPGGSITSAYPLEQGGYATLSGTSMSSPHVAGAVALLLEARPTTRAADVRGLFQNTAQPKPWGLGPNSGFLDAVHRQGAGMINIPAAIQGATTVSPSKLSLGESQGGAYSATLTVRNTGSAAATYTLRNRGNTVATGGNTYAPSFYGSLPSVSFSQGSLTVPAGGSASVNVTITPNAGLPDLSVYGGYLEVVAQDGAVAASVPYSGFKGDYQAIQVLKPTRFGFPWLAKLQGGTYVNQTTNTTYTMKGDDIAYVVAHFEHQSRVVKLEIVPLRQVGGARDLTVLESDYFGRSSTPEGFFAFEWDGSAKVNGRRTPLPMGDYQLKLTVQKALGGPSDLETWTSPVITIARSTN